MLHMDFQQGLSMVHIDFQQSLRILNWYTRTKTGTDNMPGTVSDGLVVKSEVELDDIEDIVRESDDFEGGVGRSIGKYVLPRVRATRTREKASDHVPGTQSVWVKTWGCGHNNSDGEYMAGLLAAYGYNIVNSGEAAALWVLNSCTVKNPSEQSLQGAIAKAKETEKHVVIAGCVSQGAPGTYLGYSIVGVQQIDRIVEVVEETLKGHSVRLLKEKKQKNMNKEENVPKGANTANGTNRRAGGAALSLPKIRKNPLIEIIPISTGCLNQCTYCKTKHARGVLGSYPVDEIVDRVVEVLKEGVVEIWLSSEDTGAYGKDIGRTLPELLWAIVEVMPEGTMLRIGMTNPPYILEHKEEMAKILMHPRVYKFLHIPIQAASDRVLDVMKREYTCADFEELTSFLVENVLGMTVSTDIICGFPTETAEEFEETLELVRKFKFPVLNISKFYPRPGTPAARMKRVDTSECKRRSKAATELFNSYQIYKSEERVGTTCKVLVTDVSHDGNYWVAHNQSFEQILIPKHDQYLGKTLNVSIKECGKFFMKADVLEHSVCQSPYVPPPLAQGTVSGMRMAEEKAESGRPTLSALAVALIAVAFMLGLKSIRTLYESSLDEGFEGRW
eukprot:CFRG2080T1